MYLQLKLHVESFDQQLASHVSPVEGNDQFKLIDLFEIKQESDFNEILFEKVLACLHMLTKGLFIIGRGVSPQLEEDTPTAKRPKLDDDEQLLNVNGDNCEEGSIKQLVSYVSSPNNIARLARFIRENFNGLVDDCNKLKKVHNEYILQLFRLQIKYSDASFTEIKLTDLNSPRNLRFSDAKSLIIQQFTEFARFGEKVSERTTKSKTLSIVLEDATNFWAFAICNFSNRTAEDGKVSNRGVFENAEKKLWSVTGTLYFDRPFCSEREFIDRISRYYPISSLTSSIKYKDTCFFNITDYSTLHLPSVNFTKFKSGTRDARSAQFDLVRYIDFKNKCNNIRYFYELYGFVGEDKYLIDNFAQKPEEIKQLDISYLSTEGANLIEFSKHVYELEGTFDFDNIPYLHPLKKLIHEIELLKTRAAVVARENDIKHFKDFVSESSRCKDPMAYYRIIGRYQDLASAARKEANAKNIVLRKEERLAAISTPVLCLVQISITGFNSAQHAPKFNLSNIYPICEARNPNVDFEEAQSLYI